MERFIKREHRDDLIFCLMGLSQAYREAGLTDAVASIARDAGLVHLNLFEPFQKAGATGLYHANDQHWNAAGQELAARLTLDLILSAGLLARGANPSPSR